MQKPTTTTRLIIGAIVFALAAITIFLVRSEKQPTLAEAEQQSFEVTTAIETAANYLVNTVQPDGMFEYRINANQKVTLAPRYNILRHAGTMFALSMYHDFAANEQTLAAISLAGSYLRDEALGEIDGSPNILAIWSEPEVNQIGAPRQAKLGGAGLGLVALVELHSLQADAISIEQLQSLGRFIVAMQKEDGSFYSKYIPSQGGKYDKWTSLYYPGEAALGLIMICELDRKVVWFESAIKALGFLAKSREGETTVPADHWALLATAKLFELADEADIKLPRDVLQRHALQICDSMLKTQVLTSEHAEYLGGFSPDGRTTPTATRLEGLIATLEWLPPTHAAYKPIHASVEAGIDFLLRAQVKEGIYRGGFPRAVRYIEGTSPEDMNFNQRATEIRIDYVQHAMSALIQYAELKQAN